MILFQSIVGAGAAVSAIARKMPRALVSAVGNVASVGHSSMRAAVRMGSNMMSSLESRFSITQAGVC